MATKAIATAIAIIGLRWMMVGEAADPDPLQDFCIADLSKGVNTLEINGWPCKNWSDVVDDDFVYRGFSLKVKPFSAASPYRTIANFGSERTWPGVNNQGMAATRLDMGPGGSVVPHTHPRATELVYCLEGTFLNAIWSSSGRLYTQILEAGDIAVLPRALVHFQYNIGTTRSIIIATLSSQHPLTQITGESIFGSGIPEEILEKSFFMDRSTLRRLKGLFNFTAVPRLQ